MSNRTRQAIFATLVLALLLAGWGIVARMGGSDGANGSGIQGAAAAGVSGLAAQAEAALRSGNPGAAAAAARQSLAVEPLDGESFRQLAQVAEGAGRRDEALRLYSIASARAPRDQVARVWLIQHAVEAGDYRRAASLIDGMLRLAPARAPHVFPVLAQLSRDRRFADELARVLAGDPPWRDGFLATLRKPGRPGADPVAASRVIEALRAQGALADDEYAKWLDSLMASGRWGEAFARWSALVPMPGGRLPLLYNGDFGADPGNAGFDWRVSRVPGVLFRREQAAGAVGGSAYLRFMDRGVADAGLSHALLLAPGGYRLEIRMRATNLRSALGMQWRLTCGGDSRILARSEPVDGTFDWRDARIDFTVPARQCEGQWLRLVNPVGAGSGQRVGGELWIDHVRIVRL